MLLLVGHADNRPSKEAMNSQSRQGHLLSPPHPHSHRTGGQGVPHQGTERQLRRGNGSFDQAPLCFCLPSPPLPSPPFFFIFLVSLPSPGPITFSLSLSLSLPSLFLPLSLSLSLTHIARVCAHTHRHTPLGWAVNLTYLTTSHTLGGQKKINAQRSHRDTLLKRHVKALRGWSSGS